MKTPDLSSPGLQFHQAWTNIIFSSSLLTLYEKHTVPERRSPSISSLYSFVDSFSSQHSACLAKLSSLILKVPRRITSILKFITPAHIDADLFDVPAHVEERGILDLIFRLASFMVFKTQHVGRLGKQLQVRVFIFEIDVDVIVVVAVGVFDRERDIFDAGSESQKHVSENGKRGRGGSSGLK